MRELDVLLTTYLERHYGASSESQKTAFQQLLALSDPELNAYLLGDALPADLETARVVLRLRNRTAT
jgi:antitoxin CptB